MSVAAPPATTIAPHSGRPQTPGSAVTALPLLLVVITVAVFFSVRDHNFLLFDDNRDLYQNEYLTPQPQVARFWVDAFTEVYRPMVYTVLSALIPLARLARSQRIPGDVYCDLDPHVFHIFNLLLHVINVLLVFGLLRSLLRYRAATPGDTPTTAYAAFVGALLFAIHPVQAETVSWIMGINDLLSTFFALLALWGFLAYVRGVVVGQPLHGRLLASTCCYVLAMLSKPSAAALPLIITALALVLWGRPAWRPLRWLALWLIVGAVWVPLTHLAGQSTEQVVPTPLWTRPLVAVDAAAFYICKLVWPASLGFDYGRTPVLALQRGWLFYTWLLPAALLVLAIWRRRQWPWLLAGCGVFLAALIPVSGLALFPFQAWSTVADRYLYMTMIGPALGLAWFLSTRGAKTSMIVGATLLIVGVWRTAPQAATWRDNFTFYEQALRVNPDSYVAHANLAEAYTKEQDYTAAVTHLRQARRLQPRNAQILVNLGAKLIRLKQFEEAAALQKEALTLQPGHPGAISNYSRAMIGVGLQFFLRNDLKQANACFKEALRINPRSDDAYFFMGMVASREGKWATAANYLRVALDLNPQHPKAHGVLNDVLSKLTTSSNVQKMLR